MLKQIKMKKIIILSSVFLFVLTGCNTQKESSPKVIKQYTANQLYNNENINGVAFNTDESKVLINSNKTGIQNLYALTISDTSTQPLTHSAKESLYGIDYLPGTNSYLYSSDQGGNENDHIYLQSPDNSAPKDLTPWPGSKNSMHDWSNDKKAIFVESNRRDPKYFDIWKADTSNWNFKLFYQNDSGYTAGKISKDERYIALTKDITTDKNELYLFDRANKLMKRISNDNKATWNVVAFEKNDSIMYYITNDGDEFSFLVKYNINNGATQKIYSTN